MSELLPELAGIAIAVVVHGPDVVASRAMTFISEYSPLPGGMMRS